MAQDRGVMHLEAAFRAVQIRDLALTLRSATRRRHDRVTTTDDLMLRALQRVPTLTTEELATICRLAVA